MIRLDNVYKSFTLNGKSKTVADGINCVFPTGVSVALLGRNGAGKSSMLRMIAGTMETTSGEIISDGAISWPVGFAGSFHGDLTGVQNTRFIARVYGVDTDLLIEFVEDFAELGEHFHLPLRTYSSGMRSRLAFGVSMGIQFDTYLVDEVTSVGDAAFRKKSEQVFHERMKQSSAIVVTHSMQLVRAICTAGAVLEKGKLHYYEDIETAIQEHERNMGVG
jgi:capsular polysaccharide transport system ATP-binding protein